ncbi:histone deacetylase family protein [Archangium violaceum]|uniref:histone deacetylase family protein n=1 Tax=Archangium violaceum TaxID=83451 RepID=UPI00193B8D52|nr:histone deacetylase family protein [Archangium violaceum]QRK10109.1 histone deacetylase family protein [Archangium violaceum]
MEYTDSRSANVALVTHRACLTHQPPDGHPESADRLRVLLHYLSTPEFASLIRVSAPRATREQLARAHTLEYVDSVLSIRPRRGTNVRIDPDTSMSSGSAEAALRAAGGAIAAVDLIMAGKVRSAFVAVRPPGHHAGPSRAMGYCLFNNVAVAARHARACWGLGRVAIADFDAHHGNGTQAILADDPAFFYASSHQYPCFPGTGRELQRGLTGNVACVPLIPNSTGAHFRAAWKEIILPALDRFAPELLILSAGFDAHAADPAAHLQLAAQDFAWLTTELVRIASAHGRGRIVAVLEGGYHHGALATSVIAHIRALMGSDLPSR